MTSLARLLSTVAGLARLLSAAGHGGAAAAAKAPKREVWHWQDASIHEVAELAPAQPALHQPQEARELGLLQHHDDEVVVHDDDDDDDEEVAEEPVVVVVVVVQASMRRLRAPPVLLLLLVEVAEVRGQHVACQAAAELRE